MQSNPPAINVLAINEYVQYISCILVPDLCSPSVRFGLVKLTLLEAELPEAAQYFAAVSIGQQNFSSTTSEITNVPKWDAGKPAKMLMPHAGL